MSTIAFVKIHPSIGIARIGNSPDEFFMGPEIPGAKKKPPGGYKDAQGRVKRQAARFRIYAYNKNGKLIQEIDSSKANISWTVRLANKKAAWHRFEGLKKSTPKRNALVNDRSSLVIDPGPRTLIGNNKSALFDTGTFMSTPVKLGEIRTDSKGRLIVLGGYGHSASPINTSLKPNEFANNDGWFDDVSDGPVNANVTMKGSEKVFQATGSWVICAPPDFAPDINPIITLYDSLRQRAIDKKILTASAKPSFTDDIYPILSRAINTRWVNQLKPMEEEGPMNGSAPEEKKPVSHSTIPAVIPPPGAASARKAIFEKLRDPSLPYNKESPNDNDMPMIWSDHYQKGKNQPILSFQYKFMKKWMKGNCKWDWKGQPKADAKVTPEALDKAALEACVGAPLYPGIESSWLLRDKYPFVEAFRLDVSKLSAGDITKQLAVPWQADFYDCQQEDPYAWWPHQRPDDVFVKGHVKQLKWTRQLIHSFDEMVHHWHRLGFVIKEGSTYIESERT